MCVIYVVHYSVEEEALFYSISFLLIILLTVVCAKSD
jgi:hypothetical protein